MSATDTKEKIMLVAKKTVQAHGYNALSFRDLAAEVGIKSASVHYHFPTKGDLAAELARRYTADGTAYLSDLIANYKNQRSAIQKYTDIFRAALTDENRMCLCGIMSAEHDDLPAEVRAEIQRFNEANIEWLTDLLALERPEAQQRKSIRQQAVGIFAAIGGAQLIARGQSDVTLYDEVIKSYRVAGLIP